LYTTFYNWHATQKINSVTKYTNTQYIVKLLFLSELQSQLSLQRELLPISLSGSYKALTSWNGKITAWDRASRL